MYCIVPVQQNDVIISQMNAFDPELLCQLPVIQQEVLEREERPELVGEQMAVPEMPSAVPGTQLLEEPTAGVDEELPELVPQEQAVRGIRGCCFCIIRGFKVTIWHCGIFRWCCGFWYIKEAKVHDEVAYGEQTSGTNRSH
jgi:hypothetical protein